MAAEIEVRAPNYNLALWKLRKFEYLRAVLDLDSEFVSTATVGPKIRAHIKLLEERIQNATDILSDIVSLIILWVTGCSARRLIKADWTIDSNEAFFIPRIQMLSTLENITSLLPHAEIIINAVADFVHLLPPHKAAIFAVKRQEFGF